MRCRLCGDDLSPRLLYCDTCNRITTKWYTWAREQFRKTNRLVEITVLSDNAGGPTIMVDSSDGPPEPNKFVKNPPKQLGSSTAVHIEIDDREMARGSNADIAFYLRLKATPGCTSKADTKGGGTMHLYIEPGSDAAKLFVFRMMAKNRSLPEGAKAQIKKLGFGQMLIGDGS